MLVVKLVDVGDDGGSPSRFACRELVNSSRVNSYPRAVSGGESWEGDDGGLSEDMENADRKDAGAPTDSCMRRSISLGGRVKTDVEELGLRLCNGRNLSL